MPSARFFLRRLIYAVVSLAILALTVFLFSKVGGDPVAMLLEPGASQADIDALRKQFGLDQPLLVQYFRFIGNALTGDLGMSIYYRQPVVEIYFERLPASLLLAGVAFGWSVLLGIGVGVTAAARPGGILDRVGSIVALIGLSMPAFWMGMLMIMFFSVQLHWLPSSGTGSWRNLVMPSVSLGWYFAASHMRLTRSSMIESLNSDYVRLARLKGMPEWRVILRHALPGALDPGGHAGRHQLRADGQCRGGDRDHLCLARHRAAAVRGDLVPRPAGDPRRGAAVGLDDHHSDPADRPAVRRHRPEDPS